MTARKKASTKKAAARRPPVKERARAIVADAGRYDEETRHTISNLLSEGSKDLAEFVRRAEAGEEIFDLIHPLPNRYDADPRAVARRLAERRKSLLMDYPDYRPITYKQAGELADKIIEQDDDERAFALITLLHGITAVYFEQRRGEREGADFRGPDVESLTFEAAKRAYTKTVHCGDARREFSNLPPGTVEAMGDEELRKEVWGAKEDEP